MNQYKVTIYYQIQLYNGWSCRYPYNQIVDRCYVVASERTKKEFEALLISRKCDTYLKTHVSDPLTITVPAITEHEMFLILQTAHLEISSIDINVIDELCVNPPKMILRDKYRESEQLYIKSLQTDEVSSIHEFGDSNIVILRGLIYGVMANDKCLVPFGMYKWISPSDSEFGYARVISNEKWGVINSHGSIVIPVEYNYIRPIQIINGQITIEYFTDGAKQIAKLDVF